MQARRLLGIRKKWSWRSKVKTSLAWTGESRTSHCPRCQLAECVLKSLHQAAKTFEASVRLPLRNLRVQNLVTTCCQRSLSVANLLMTLQNSLSTEALRPSSHGEFATKSSTSHQQISPTSRDSPGQAKSSKWKLGKLGTEWIQNGTKSWSTASLSSLGKIFLPKNGSLRHALDPDSFRKANTLV